LALEKDMIFLRLSDGARKEDVMSETYRHLEHIEYCLAGDFPATLLADCGSEFSDAVGIEASTLFAKKRTNLYYCDPMRSDQKARCESAHRLIRRILPKGSSLDGLTDEDVGLVCSHVNSMPRKFLDGKPPLLLATEHLPECFFKEFDIVLIPAREIVLKPRLLGLK
jgi:IS30 family transposase